MQNLRISEDVSKFAVPAAKLGLGYGLSGISRLVDIVAASDSHIVGQQL